jgi:hypothetical protein
MILYLLKNFLIFLYIIIFIKYKKNLSSVSSWLVLNIAEIYLYNIYNKHVQILDMKQHLEMLHIYLIYQN